MNEVNETQEEVTNQTQEDYNDTGEKNNEEIEESAKQQEGSTDELKTLQEKIEQLQKELEAKEDRLLRIQAEYDNYRKRTRNEMEALKEYGSQDLATELLPALDNFERALQSNVTSEDGKALLQGVEMVYKSILDTFKNAGIEPIEAVGKEFDPHEHHAVIQGNDDQYDSNIVIEELQKGYKLKDRVIRPAMVKVNQ
ncbi:nucleotide exchange factor GrpE [Pallidibacillus pasinlerensis]|uniref:Protein GrpE n=1 Tax=Pallidibacillus pasinlerensis TaxID=2703818 RepID=A0ABX0A202_9BACI|nr:nucleotide exchange factor GrpE [Pallidibacillus pasinlerensis]